MDEAYIDFCLQATMVAELKNYPHLPLSAHFQSLCSCRTSPRECTLADAELIAL